MDKLTFKEWSILADLETIAPIDEDFEFSMARGELKTAQAAITRLMTKLKGEGDLEAWVQSKITKAAEYLDTVADHLSHGEDDTVRTKEVKEGFKGHKSVEEIAKKHKVSPSSIQKQLEMGMKVEHEHTTDDDEAMDIALQHLDEIPNYYSKLKKMEKVKEEWTELHDANGNTFAHVIDIIKGSDYKFKSFTNVQEGKKMKGEDPCWKGYEMIGKKKKGGKEVPNCVPVKEESESMRYCPKCGKNETSAECKYGEGYWRMFSLPSSLAPEQPYSIAKVHPANENVSFDIGSGHKQAQKQAKIRNLATGTTNPNEKSAALRKLSGPSLPLADSVIQPGQLTNEDYQRIQSTGNVYTILFSWRGRPMMNLQLFFPNMKRPSKDEVKKEIEKFYPGAVIMQWYPSPTDPSKPIVVIQGN